MSPHWFPRRGWPLAVPLALVLAASPISPTGAAAAPATGAAPTADVSAAGETLTLVTGDRVTLEPGSDSRLAATIDPAPRSGPEPVFETIAEGEDVYVLPSDVVPLVPELLDKELFNVTKLAEYGYTGGVPVIVTRPDSAPRATAATTAGMSVDRKSVV